jgi:hypothetical protein
MKVRFFYAPIPAFRYISDFLALKNFFTLIQRSLSSLSFCFIGGRVRPLAYAAAIGGVGFWKP